MEGVENLNIDKENNNSLIIESEDIPKDIKFDTWDEVDNYFDEYGARNGFAISKKMAEAVLKGMQRNTKTKKLSCQWHINLTYPEQATQIGVTTFVNQHNHILMPNTREFATKYRSFTDEALNEISLMTKHGNLTLTI
ncbi:hypothetical protein C1645_813449 [Glomus cerebriforme]|uniref:FAR1 domain-containing protein n=1 Tax=Glomus cerebriforme TaxID=658196 RepID=A0A397TLW1_9GLOM|nr:hypothetical protein C1645_813449 [Glomus cerebriforme]